MTYVLGALKWIKGDTALSSAKARLEVIMPGSHLDNHRIAP